MISVKRLGDRDPLRFDVIVREGNGETRHQVTMSHNTLQELAGGAVTPEHCIQAAFRFLLDREPKESILSHFDVTLITRYFPEFPRKLPNYLQAR